MKLTKTKDAVSQLVESGGLFSVRLDYQVKSTTASGKYSGPKFTKEMWNEILAFFAWTNKEHDSESQVRLFVNTNEKKWAAHAMPQKASTGLSADELDTDDGKKQRALLFPEDKGWLYWGTVHHHCKLGAFQSGTDEANEKTQEGLHITIGLMDKPLHDMHARIYVSGNCFDPDMSDFWDIGEVGRLIPDDLHDKVARHQMCIPAPTDTAIPKQWKDNVIEVKKEKATCDRYGFHTGAYEVDTHWSVRARGTFSATETADYLLREAKDYDVDPLQLLELLEYLDTGFVKEVFDALLLERFKPEEIIPEINTLLFEKEEEAERLAYKELEEAEARGEIIIEQDKKRHARKHKKNGKPSTEESGYLGHDTW